MKNNIISILLVIVIIITVVIMFPNNKGIPYTQSIDTHEIDSLKRIIEVQKYIININDKKIDSLHSIKAKITNNYETIIKDYSDPNTVSNDSISRYISTKLHSK